MVGIQPSYAVRRREGRRGRLLREGVSAKGHGGCGTENGALPRSRIVVKVSIVGKACAACATLQGATPALNKKRPAVS